ncbi:MAG: hypothetical protein ABIP79_15175 [Chitinophagaceae bacterium]
MTKRILIAITISLFILSCANDKNEEKVTDKIAISIDSTLVTDSSWGAITGKTDIQGLREIFGEANVVDERICGLECTDSIDVTKIYKETNKEFIIYWADSFYHKSINMIECYAEGAPYHTATGLKMGRSMQDILTENGKPINFLGFGWDYGGNIISYNKGKLDSSNIKFRLDLPGEVENQTLFGDTELSTTNPDFKEYFDKMLINRIYLFFNEQPYQ